MWLTGSGIDEEENTVPHEAVSSMDQAGMTLTKWCSNSTTVAEDII